MTQAMRWIRRRRRESQGTAREPVRLTSVVIIGVLAAAGMLDVPAILARSNSMVSDKVVGYLAGCGCPGGSLGCHTLAGEA